MIMTTKKKSEFHPLWSSLILTFYTIILFCEKWKEKIKINTGIVALDTESKDDDANVYLNNSVIYARWIDKSGRKNFFIFLCVFCFVEKRNFLKRSIVWAIIFMKRERTELFFCRPQSASGKSLGFFFIRSLSRGGGKSWWKNITYLLMTCYVCFAIRIKHQTLAFYSFIRDCPLTLFHIFVLLSFVM